MKKRSLQSLIREALAEVVEEMTCTGAVAGFQTPKAFKKKKKVYENSNEEPPLYVQYDSERAGEEPFEMHGQKYQYVNAIYPGGKKDIGVYAFGQDMVYSYDAFRKMHNIKEMSQPEHYDDATDSFAPGPREREEDFQTPANNPTKEKEFLKLAAELYKVEQNPDHKKALATVIRSFIQKTGL